MMKKITYIFTFLLITTSINAQFKKGSKEKIKTLKIAHITEKLDLTESEAEKFWPIYNKFDEQLMEIRFSERKILKKRIKELGGFDAITEKQAKEISKKILALEKSFYVTKQKLHDKLADVISYKKLLKLEMAEKDFHRKLLQKLRSKKRKKE